MSRIVRRIEEIAVKATKPAVKRGYLAEDYDGLGSTVLVRMSQGSSSGVLASVAAGAFGTEQELPLNTPVMLLENRGKLEVVSLGSKLAAQAISTDMLSQEMTIEDPAGFTVIDPSGFAGAWSDYLAGGVYNSGMVGTPGELPEGETAALPYWEIRKTGSPTVTLMEDSAYPSGYKVRVAFSALTDKVEIIGRPIPVAGGRAYHGTYVQDGNEVTGVVSINAGWQGFDGDGEYVTGTQTAGGSSFPITEHPQLYDYLFNYRFPMNVRFVRPYILFTESGSHSASNWLEISSLSIAMSATQVDANSTSFLMASARIDELDIGYITGGIQAGAGDVTGDGTQVITETVTFGQEFVSAPVVVASPDYSGRSFVALVSGISTTGFTIRITQKDDNTFTATVGYTWIAVGEVAPVVT